MATSTIKIWGKVQTHYNINLCQLGPLTSIEDTNLFGLKDKERLISIRNSWRIWAQNNYQLIWVHHWHREAMEKVSLPTEISKKNHLLRPAPSKYKLIFQSSIHPLWPHYIKGNSPKIIKYSLCFLLKQCWQRLGFSVWIYCNHLLPLASQSFSYC